MKFHLLRINKLARRIILILLITWLPLSGFWIFMTPAQALDSPIHVHLTWQHETDTTMTVTWRTGYSDSGDLVLFDNVSRGGTPAAYRFNTTGTNFYSTSVNAYIHVVELVNLTPDMIYYFICGGVPAEPKGGYSVERAFRTAPSSARNIRFVVGGDSRTNDAERQIVSQAMAKYNPEFVLHSGDMVEYGSIQGLWDTWFNDVDFHWIGTNNLTIPIMPVIGNHEQNSANYYDQFALPGNEMWYSYDWGPGIHITCLSTETIVTGAQQTWLENDLRTHANFTWKFAIFHAPAISGSRDPGRLDVKASWVPIFDKYHVDIVFNGHDHIYLRTVPMNLTHSETELQKYENGTMYVITGGWGAPLYTPLDHWYNAYSASVYHFGVIDIFTNRTLHLQTKNDQGVTFDEAWIIKPPTTTDDYDELWHTSDFTINLTVKNNFTGNAETYYRINGDPILNVSGNGQPSITTEGANNRLEYWSVGYNNSEELHHQLIGIKLDKTNPAANAGGNTTIGLGALMEFDGGASTDNVAIENYTWTFTDGTPKVLAGASPSYAFSSLGTYQVTLNVSDYAGRWDTAIMWVTVVDLTGPTTMNNYDGLWHMADFSINLTANDSTSGVAVTYYKINDGILQNIGGTGQPYINIEGSNNKLEYWSVDLADNEELPHHVLTGIKLDKTSPLANAMGNVTLELGAFLMFNGSGSTDNVAIENYTWTFTDGTPKILAGVSPSYAFSSLGTYQVTLNVSDYAGWWDGAIMWVTVIDASPPNAKFTVIQLIDVSQSTLFNASQSSDNVAISSYYWDFGDGTPPETRVSPLINHTFLHPGTFLVTLNVTDGAGLWHKVNSSVQVEDSILPIANFSAIQKAVVGTIIAFNANSSSDNGMIIRYTWDFGDGNITISLTPQISHNYLKPGIYFVNLTVTDEGNNTASVFLSIEIQGAQKQFPEWLIGVLLVGGATLILVSIWGDKPGKKGKGPEREKK